ncbi:MAG: DUF4440 domain-containing protein [Polyangiales bacterium]
MKLSAEEESAVQELEEKLWIPKSRFDRAWIDRVLAPDFLEYGRSGRQYSRQQAVDVPFEPFVAKLPLPEFRVRVLAPDVVQATYISEAEFGGVVERARRSSLWSRVDGGWQLRFHQGTPID